MRSSGNLSRRHTSTAWSSVDMDEPTSQERNRATALVEQLEWLQRNGLIDGYQLTPSGDVGEVILSAPAAQLVRAGRQPVEETGFLNAVRSSPEAARQWLAREAEGTLGTWKADPP
jgi:hypothetical protein